MKTLGKFLKGWNSRNLYKFPQRNFCYLVTQFDCELSKIGYFQSSKSIFDAKFNLIFLKTIFLFEFQNRWTTLIISFYILNVPYFWWLIIKMYYKISKDPLMMFIEMQKRMYLLSFIWSHEKFHNYHHTCAMVNHWSVLLFFAKTSRFNLTKRSTFNMYTLKKSRLQTCRIIKL